MSLKKDRFPFFEMVISILILQKGYKWFMTKGMHLHTHQNDMKKICDIKCQEATLNFELENMQLKIQQ